MWLAGPEYNDELWVYFSSEDLIAGGFEDGASTETFIISADLNLFSSGVAFDTDDVAFGVEVLDFSENSSRAFDD